MQLVDPVQSHRLETLVLHREIDMVLEILSHIQLIQDHGYAKSAQMIGVAESIGSCGVLMAPAPHDHLTLGQDPVDNPLFDVLDADGPGAVEQHPQGEGIDDDSKIFPCPCGADVRVGGAASVALVDVEVKMTHPFLLAAVEVAGMGMTCLTDGLEKGPVQRIGITPGLDPHRSVAATVVVVPPLNGSRSAGSTATHPR